ncbi:MAG: alkaline shock response membrane anchor protein AmaP [Clostridia bacterium]|nr:alkaline shock response membrane anchor protein AmaP [Clostridia bacterium]
MKHPVKDRLLILLCALVALCGTVAAVALILGKVTLEPVLYLLERASYMGPKTKIVLGVIALVFALFALLLIRITLPAKKKRSSTFAIQQNENGMVRISLKALDTLVQKCLGKHAELKVVSSSLYSDEQSVRVDVHIALQSDISMPLAISALQKQIKKYLEACSGVVVKEVRIFVDGTLPANEETAKSPFAIPASLLGAEQETLPAAKEEEQEIVIEVPKAEEKKEEPAPAAQPEQEPAAEPEEEQPAEEAAPAEQEQNPSWTQSEPLFSDSTDEYGLKR